MKKLRIALVLAVVVSLPFIPQIVGETTYFTSFAANFVFKNNFHEIVPGKFFRAGEMTPEELTQSMKSHNIKTVIDLRLSVDDIAEEQGISEKEVVERAGGKYFHIPFSSARADQKEQVEQLLAVYDSLDTPVLVHCSSGTHRSGIASAIWLLEKEGESVETAGEQISAKYGFFQIERDLKAFFQGKPTLDAIFHTYAKECPNKEESFRNWLRRKAEFRSPAVEPQSVK